MNVLLKPEVEKFIAEKLRDGQYADVSDVVNEALEALMEQDDFTHDHEAYLSREVKRGLDQLNAGQLAEFDAAKIIAEERRRLAGESVHK